MPENNFILGKGPYEHDPRTLMMARYVLPDVKIPTTFDFDKNRAPFPWRMWGNDQYGDCVIAGEANHILRLERVEQRGTVKLSDKDAVNRYKSLTGCQTPGDSRDTGLVVLYTMRNWQKSGFESAYNTSGGVKTRNYKIAAYGELEPQDDRQLRMATYVFHGIHMGFWLPWAANRMTSDRLWDYNGETGDDWEPGSWGGHLVYAKKYDANAIYVMTWGMEVKVTNAFIQKYCDEAWAVVDSLDSWRTKETINVSALTEKLQEISTKVNQ